MDFSESTKVVYDRIQKLEAENVHKVIGYVLLQDHGEREMIRLAFSADSVIQSFINKAKTELGLSSKTAVSASISHPQANPAPVSDLPLRFTPFSPASSQPFSSPATRWATHPYWDPQDPAGQQAVHNSEFVPAAYSDTVAVDDYCLQNQLQFLSLDDQLEPVNSIGSDFSSNFYYPESTLGPRTNRRSPSLPEYPVKVCHYFSKGFCKNGSNCRFFHGRPFPESFSQIFSPCSNEIVDEDHIFPPGSLEKLETELTELLKLQRGFPVSIASLPMLYYETYGKTLQAESYLTESQRHGKVGYSLTKLLARLNNSIRLIDRPHGQHSIILAKDVPKYMHYIGERNEHGAIVACSRQIYLTFPADSTFTEQDVTSYFSKFGHVQDVRIPCQLKRMFGFVTFVFVETVNHILAKGNPHFVGGARVLVKPYREKSKLVDRKYPEKIQHPVHYGSPFLDPELELSPMTRIGDNTELLRKQLMDEHEQALELERRRFVEFHLAAKSMNHPAYFGYAMDELKLSEARAEKMEFPSASHFNYLLDVLNNSSTSEDKVMHINTNYNDQESSQGLNLPDSPFASPLWSGLSAVK